MDNHLQSSFSNERQKMPLSLRMLSGIFVKVSSTIYLLRILTWIAIFRWRFSLQTVLQKSLFFLFLGFKCHVFLFSFRCLFFLFLYFRCFFNIFSFFYVFCFFIISTHIKAVFTVLYFLCLLFDIWFFSYFFFSFFYWRFN